MPIPVFKLATAASALTLAFSALAVEFGPLKLKSSLGEPLHAEIDLRAQSGDALAPGCIKVFAPTAQHLPLVPGVTLSWLAGTTGAVLAVRSGQPLVEPALVFGLEANCGAGRVWQEFPVLLAPLAGPAPAIRSSEWIVAPGESPRSLAQLLYPGQQAAQRRFIHALAEANPGLGIDEAGTQALVAGSSLQMPDWRSLGARNSSAPVAAAGERPIPAKRVQRASANAAGSASINSPVPDLSLRLARTLQPAQEASEPLRQVLRLEYRLLSSLNEQFSLNEQLSVLMATVPGRELAQLPALRLQPAPVLLAKETAGPLEAAAGPAPAPSAPIAPPPATPVAEEKPEPPPVKIRQVPAPSPMAAPASGHETEWWIYFAGAGGVVLLLLVLFVRRRRVPAEMAAPAFHSPETVLMSHPPPSVSKAGMEAFYAEPAASPQQAAKAAPLPQAPAPTDVNPVMELAEIMLSFGRLEGAVQTLQEYIEANPKEALQPWMKLLEIYRTGGMHAEFDDLAGKLNRHFNVEVQRWSNEAPPPAPADENQLAKALCLEELPHIIEQLVAKWGRPECLDYLHRLLRDNRGGQRSGFALPVVQEILLLIEIMVARQAAGNI